MPRLVFLLALGGCAPPADRPELSAGGLVASLSDRATSVVAGDATVAISLERWGRAGAMRPALEGQVGRVDCDDGCDAAAAIDRGTLIEGWEQRDDGLEQSFTVLDRPAGDGPLRFDVRFRGARVVGDGTGTGVLLAAPGQHLRYAGLEARDRDGRRLPARIEVLPGTARLVVDDQGASWPITVNPVLFQWSWSVESNQDYARLGRAAASAGDLNQAEVLRSLGLNQAFKPEEFASGPATWRFARVSHLQRGILIFNALQFAQRTPEKVIEAAWNNVGRAAEIEHYGHHPIWLTLAVGPSGGDAGRAFTRAVQVMSDAELNVVEPTPEGVAAGLVRLGLVPGQRGGAEA